MMIERVTGHSLGDELRSGASSRRCTCAHTSFPVNATTIAGRHARATRCVDGKLRDVTVLNPSGIVGGRQPRQHRDRHRPLLARAARRQAARAGAAEGDEDHGAGLEGLDRYGLGIMPIRTACGSALGQRRRHRRLQQQLLEQRGRHAPGRRDGRHESRRPRASTKRAVPCSTRRWPTPSTGRVARRRSNAVRRTIQPAPASAARTGVARRRPAGSPGLSTRARRSTAQGGRTAARTRPAGPRP